jgi:RNA polymerase sigma factor (sigma-70 family)
MPASDGELLAEFARQRSGSAFAEVARRYSNLVYAAARRQVCEPSQAEDVTQAVFIVLAKKAASIPPAKLPAWLLTVTRLCAKDANRKQFRRTLHEREAAMARPELLQYTESFDPQIAACLDEAMGRLRSRDATAIALRYLQDKPLNDVAAVLGVSPNAAQKIVARALVKLRKILANRGVATASPAILSGALLQEATHVAPATLAISPSASGTLGLSIAKGVSHMLLWTKVKITAAVTTATLLISGAGIIAVMKTIDETEAADSLPRPPAAVTPQPGAPQAANSVAPFESPFLELVGCRIKQSIPLTLSNQAQNVADVSLTAMEYNEVSWKINENLGGGVDSYSITVTPTTDPGAAQTLHADKSADTQSLGDLLAQPGEYDIKVWALGAHSKSIASTVARVNVKPLPYTQINIDDIQPDGLSRFAYVDQSMNNSGRVIRQDGFRNSDMIHVTSMGDADGNPIKFTSSHQGDVYFYRCTFPTPIQPGDPLFMSNAGTATSLVRPLGKGVYTYSFRHSPGSNQPTRRIELFRLPDGAKLLYSSDNIKHKVIDGRVQLYMETIIPLGGSNLVEFRYRLPL